MKTPVMESRRLLMREVQKEDVDAVFNCWMQDEEVSKYMWWKASGDIAEAKRFIDFELGQVENEKWNRWILQKKDSLEVIGTCLVFWNDEDEKPHWDISYNLGRKYWGYGYTTEAMKEVMHFAKTSLSMRECVTSCARANIASSKVLYKLGFKEEASIPYICSRGEIRTEGILYRYQA